MPATAALQLETDKMRGTPLVALKLRTSADKMGHPASDTAQHSALEAQDDAAGSSCSSRPGSTAHMTHPSSEEPSRRNSVPGTGGPTVPLCPLRGSARKLAAHVSVSP